MKPRELSLAGSSKPAGQDLLWNSCEQTDCSPRGANRGLLQKMLSTVSDEEDGPLVGTGCHFSKKALVD